MGGVAALARAAGHKVTGCDRNVYPPMSTQLKELGIDIAFKDSMSVDYEMGMNSINNSSLEIARQDHMEIYKVMNK